MSSVIAGLFTTGIEMTGGQRLLLMFPLCLVVAIVYRSPRLSSGLRLSSACTSSAWVFGPSMKS